MNKFLKAMKKLLLDLAEMKQELYKAIGIS